MANDKIELNKREINRRNKANRTISGNLNKLLSQLNVSAYGAPTNNDVERLNKEFDEILQNETNSLNRSVSGEDTTSFIGNLFSSNKSAMMRDGDLLTQLNNIFDDTSNEGTIQSFINDQYRNRLLKQSDLHEIASQLIELREAILVTRDAITSSEMIEGKMSRTLKFTDTGTNRGDDQIPIVEAMEKKFKLQDKIKNFIVPNTLEYGEYYAYVIPYSKIFGDFMKIKDNTNFGYNMYHESGESFHEYKEKTLLEFVTEASNGIKGVNKDIHTLFESTYENKSTDVVSRTDVKKMNIENEGIFTEGVKNMMSHITICNDPLPINILEEGFGSIDFFKNNCLDENFNEKYDIEIDKIGADSYFNQVMNASNGLYEIPKNPRGGSTDTSSKAYQKQFKNINDCYLRMIDPIHLIPVKIMTKTIGYYYIKNEEISPETGMITSSLYYNRFDDQRKNQTVVDAIATKIVMSFDKEFLVKNEKFKDLIVEALQYYNLNEQRVRFQFIPAEYIVPFKIQEDVDGNGTSILDPSLFYAKLYLMLLLFKIMSIILYSNDQRINYIRTSGIDTNVRKKVEEIARKKDEKRITVMDLFSYTSLVNKLGVGAETYMPTGKNNERGMETDVIAGQEVQMNTDFMNDLRKSYILGTGVPDAIMNYLNEADFAKSLEIANTRFLGRVVSYQMDFNEGITDLYKRMMKWCTTLNPSDIDGFEFSFNQAKNNNLQIRSDALQNFDANANWIISQYIGQANMDNPKNEPIVRAMKKALAKLLMNNLNFNDIDRLWRDSNIEGLDVLLKPVGAESDDDVDLAGL